MSNLPPPNSAIAELIHGLGHEDARDLVGMFLNGFDTTLRTLQGPDLEEQRRAAHSLKSSARIVGLMELAHLMSKLEERLSKTDGAVTAAEIAAARKEFETESPALRAFVDGADI